MSDLFKFDHRFSFVWHTTWSEPCEKCLHLDGTTWDNVSLFDNILYDPIWGDIWDLNNDLPLTHPNCKCYLEVRYESSLEELLNIQPSKFEEFKIMTSNIKEMKEDIADFEKDLARAEGRIENVRAQLTAYLLLLQRAGLPPEIEKAISIIVRAKMTVEQTTRALYLLMAASGPWGWALAAATTGISLVGAYGVAESTRDLVMDLGGT